MPIFDAWWMQEHYAIEPYFVHMQIIIGRVNALAYIGVERFMQHCNCQCSFLLAQCRVI